MNTGAAHPLVTGAVTLAKTPASDTLLGGPAARYLAIAEAALGTVIVGAPRAMTAGMAGRIADQGPQPHTVLEQGRETGTAGTAPADLEACAGARGALHHQPETSAVFA